MVKNINQPMKVGTFKLHVFGIDSVLSFVLPNNAFKFP